MKVLILSISLLVSAQLLAEDTIKKWKDEKGRIHYGDRNTSENATKPETVEVKDTFDKNAYEDAVIRHKETEAYADELETERLNEEKEKKEQLKADRVNRVPPPARTILVTPQIIPRYGRPIYGNPNPGHPGVRLTRPEHPVTLPEN